jgi:hypothetical protein
MEAIGQCGATLRVREDDCSIEHLADAYGAKPFMLTARQKGFSRFSCRYDELPIENVINAGRGR